jgi:hypothetical protein
VIAEKTVGRKEAAWRTLQATYGKFREGFDTYDLGLAKQVLNGSYSHGGAVGAGARRVVPVEVSIDPSGAANRPEAGEFIGQGESLNRRSFE